jgi:hypothetical protein
MLRLKGSRRNSAGYPVWMGAPVLRACPWSERSWTGSSGPCFRLHKFETCPDWGGNSTGGVSFREYLLQRPQRGGERLCRDYSQFLRQPGLVHGANLIERSATGPHLFEVDLRCTNHVYRSLCFPAVPGRCRNPQIEQLADFTGSRFIADRIQAGEPPSPPGDHTASVGERRAESPCLCGACPRVW